MKAESTPGKCFNVDAMAQLGFGQNIGMVEKPEQHFIANYLDLFGLRTAVYFQWPELFQLGLEKCVDLVRAFLPSSRRFGRWRAEYIRQVIDANGQAKRGIFSHVVQGSDKPQEYRYTPAQMAAEGSFLVLTGNESNATALAGALFYLSRFSGVRKKLEDEIWKAFPDARDISDLPPSPLASLQYLNAIITEVLRISPAGPGAPWREVMEGGAVIDGNFIPAGVEVGVCSGPFQRRPSVFRDPHRFWPERWLPGTLPTEELDLAQRCHKPFGLGARACAGKKVAMMQIRLALVKLLWHCEMKIPTGPLGRIGEGDPAHGAPGRQIKNDFQLVTHFGAVTQGPWLQFRTRVPSSRVAR